MEVIQHKTEFEGRGGGAGKEQCRDICRWMKNLRPPAHGSILESLGDVFGSRHPGGADRGSERWKCGDECAGRDQRWFC